MLRKVVASYKSQLECRQTLKTVLAETISRSCDNVKSELSNRLSRHSQLLDQYLSSTDGGHSTRLQFDVKSNLETDDSVLLSTSSENGVSAGAAASLVSHTKPIQDASLEYSQYSDDDIWNVSSDSEEINLYYN
jgi:hypothetical protein